MILKVVHPGGNIPASCEELHFTLIWRKPQQKHDFGLRGTRNQAAAEKPEAGVVQFWHTPFGDLQSSGSQSKLDPVFMHHDGSLVIPNSSIHHGGLYYCILRHAEGSTLWPFELHVDQNMAAEAEDGRGGGGGGGGGGCAARRFRRNAAFLGEREAVIPDEIFAGAVAASVLLTFVVGFSAGALSRTPVLRCLKSLAPKQRRRQPEEPDGSQVTMTTLPPMYDNQACRTAATPRDSRFWRTTETQTPLSTPSPPAKPMRSFRLKAEEKEEDGEPEITAYLEGCDSNLAEEETGSGEDGEAKEEDESAKPDEKEDDEESEAEDREEDEDGEASAEEEVREEEEQKTDESGELEQESAGTDDERSVKAEAEPEGEEPPSGSPRRRSRVIRLYQYDEDGQRFGHLPDTEAPEPGPRPRQRSRSLTRLNAIMAAAATGPMEATEPEEEKQLFHMDI
ncbi:uncharacterized protein LOC111611935 isoform X1 [Xiphophorus maculatus]|uniref:uncharacterized protein LOC111611935 isoform X1 n=1 Tax=Xiphophorus maculatus TaxID=8083 RepID=UPI000C6ECC0B|nr:uncharacterized protein LOC111611935 isoform X1 [Xiphophorus maculatus]